MSSVFNKIHQNLRMGEGCVAVETEESQDVIEEIRSEVYSINKKAEKPEEKVFIAFWDVVRGLQDIDGDILSTTDPQAADDMAALGMTSAEPEACSAFDAIKMFLDISTERRRNLENGVEDPNDEIKQVLVLRNFDRELTPQQGSVNSRLLMAVQHLITVGRMTDVMLVLLNSTGTELPVEIKEHLASVYHGLPVDEERQAIIEDLVDATSVEAAPDSVKRAVEATSGLSRAWTERSVSEALSRYKELDASKIAGMKAEHLRKDGLLDLWTPELNDPDSFFVYENLIGLNGLKNFVTNGSREGVPDRAKLKGILLVGVPGTGKSFFMRCTSSELGAPLSEMSTANLYSKWVGETDKNLRKMLTTVEHIGGILGIDEYQRFMPTGGADEGRTTQSVAGGMLTWQNNQNNVLVLAAANDISAIPPEFTRSGRFDTTFFVGFPSREAKDAAWEMYRNIHELEEQDIPADEHWTPSDISVCCKMAEQQGVSLVDAAKFIKICYSGTGKKVIDDLMDWAENAGCLDAETGELFVHPRRKKSASSAGKAPKRTVRSVSK